MNFTNEFLKLFFMRNIGLTKIISIPIIFIEEYLMLLFITTILHLKPTKQQKIKYLFLSSSLEILCSIILPKAYFILISFITIAFSIKFIFNIDLLNAICSELLPVIFIVLTQSFINGTTIIISKIPFSILSIIPIYQINLSLVSYILLFILYNYVKKKKYYLNLFNILNKSNKNLIICNVILTITILLMQTFLIIYYSYQLPIFIFIMNMTLLISYFIFNFLSFIKIITLEQTQIALEQEKLSYKTLQIANDSTRAFKHDFANIIAGIGGYIKINDMKGLQKYYNQLFTDYNKENTYSNLNPETINNPAVYSILANKFYKAESLNITINLDCFINFNSLKMDIYEFSRILGILLDNAIEASAECDNKIINVFFFNPSKFNNQILRIENTYKNKNIDLNKISEKGFTSKPQNTGLGLWEVNRIIKKYDYINLSTYIKNDLFIQCINNL